MPAEEAKVSMLPKAELLQLVKDLTVEMQTPGFLERATEALRGIDVQNGDAMMEAYERVQGDFMTDKGHNGVDVMRQLRVAAKEYPGEDTEEILYRMCELEESQLFGIAQTLVGSDPTEAGAHGHSHNGKPCHGHSHDGQAHGHNHDGQPCHGHSHGEQVHGHSHNGQPCHGHSHGNMDPAQMMNMQMAFQSLSQTQRSDMMRIRQKMMMGRQPTKDEMEKMQGIQAHISAFMQTIQQFSATPPS